MKSILSDILVHCKDLVIEKKRCMELERVEVVILQKELEQWYVALGKTLGEPVKPAGVAPTEEHMNWTRDYGGVAKHQVLFKKDFDQSSVIVMMWPWADSTYITMHMSVTVL
jgi:hypothetical protein